MTPKISVIFPVAQREAYLAEAIESILGQSFTDFEFLIIEIINPERKILKETENKYLLIAKNEQDKTYNLNFESQGGKLSEYSIQKIRPRF